MKDNNSIPLQQLAKIQANSHWFTKAIFMLSFLMAFPALLIGPLNASLILFIYIFVRLSAIRIPLSFRNISQWAALFFGFGAIMSFIYIPDDYSIDARYRALDVLPNYIYWSVLVIFLVTMRKYLPIYIIYKGIFWGVVCSLIYYIFLQSFLTVIPIFKAYSPNIFSFILICYTPLAISHSLKKYGRLISYALLTIILLILLSEGRRAGLGLVFLGSMPVLFFDKIKVKNILVALVALIIVLFSLNSNPVKNFIYSTSERIYEIIYESDQVSKTDISYLTRVAQVQKGLKIFNQYPWTGIGLNNFTNFDTGIISNFEGSKLVVHRKGMFSDTSAHNSYISLLAEGGLLLLCPLLLLLILNILRFLIYYNRLSDFVPVGAAIITMSIHLYFISAIVNVFAWYLIGLGAALITEK